MRVLPDFTRQSGSTTFPALVISLAVVLAGSVSHGLAHGLCECSNNNESMVLRNETEDKITEAAGKYEPVVDEVYDVESILDGSAEQRNIIEVKPSPAGERRVVDAFADATFLFSDQTFDPAAATYVIAGNDLVVTSVDGGIVVLAGFFAESERPPNLIVLDGPSTPANELLQRAEATPTPLMLTPPARRFSLWWRRR